MVQFGSIDLTPQNRRGFDQQFVQQEMNVEARWRDFNAQRKQSAVLTWFPERMPGLGRSLDMSMTRIHKSAIQFASESVSPFDQLNELLAPGRCPFRLKIQAYDEEILAQHRNDGTSFSIAQIQMGRGTLPSSRPPCLSVESETVIADRRPERHLAIAIIEPFLSALFQRQPSRYQDCAFIIRHTRSPCRLLTRRLVSKTAMVRSCEWNGATAKAWDVEILEANVEFACGLQARHLRS